MSNAASEQYVFFSDGAAVDDDTIVVAAGFAEAPDAATSRIYLKFADEWLAHEVAHDFIVSIAHRDGAVYAVGKNGLVKTVGDPGTHLSPKRVKGKFRDYIIRDAEDRGHLERVRGVGAAFYACGWGGQIYRLHADSWARLENGLEALREDDFLDIDGLAEDDLYVAGLNGAAAHYDGKRWRYLDLPTNAHIYSVKCLAPGDVVLAGSNGCLLRGNARAWQDLSDPGVDANFWSVCPYDGKLYIAYGDNGLYAYAGGKFSNVKFGRKKNPLTHRLDATATVLWSFGSANLLRFDGKAWSEAICPDNA